ncbi:MAG: hypothetical protein GXO99_04065 [Nitrospirae bacterium]|nr:hypothetical protein [Nitrospirota bacterium]
MVVLAGLFKTKKANSDEVQEVVNAASMLQVSEYRFFEIAYEHWYGSKVEEKRLKPYYERYFNSGEVPPWVRHLARRVLSEAQRGVLNPEDYGIKPQKATLKMKIKGILIFILLALLCFLFYLIVIREYVPYF